MIEIFKTRQELERDSTCSNEHINRLLQKVRKIYGDILFVETIRLEDKGFFNTKRYIRYCLYYISVEDQNELDSFMPVSVLNLSHSTIDRCIEDYKIIVYLKGLLDGYQLLK